MALQPLLSKRVARALAVVLAVSMVATVGLLLTAPVRGAFTSLTVTPGLYSGTNRFVPTETMQITITADSGDVYDVQISSQATCPPYNRNTAIVRQTFNNVTIPFAGVRTLAYPIPADMPDGDCYYVSVHDSLWYENGNTGTTFDTYRFRVHAWNFNVQTDRAAYLPGDTVTVIWSATLIKDGSPAPNGLGELQAYDAAGASLVSPARFLFNASQGSTSFTLGAAEAPNTIARVYGWFNDTAGLRHTNYVTVFSIRYLGLIANVGRPTYSPGAIVTVDISAKITANPGNPNPNDPGAAGATVNVTVIDQGTGNPVTAYGRAGLVTDAQGDLTYVFQLAATPTSGDYQIQAHAVAKGTSLMTADATDTFSVVQTSQFSVNVVLNKGQYLSGDTVTATATVFSSTAGNYTYTWRVTDQATGNILTQVAGGTRTFAYPTAADYQGTLVIRVTVNDGAGNTAANTAFADVAFGYLALSLSPTEYNPGETITASFSLLHGSAVLTNPTYYYEVRDQGGATVASGSVTGNSASFRTPDPASPSYTFTITASQDGRVVTGSATAREVGGFLLSISLDKTSYLPGDTMQITYAITPRGNSVLPLQFQFFVSLFGGTSAQVTTTSATGVLSLPIPQGTSQGDLILSVEEFNTGAQVSNIVHVGAVNPLATQVAGIPLYDILLTLLVVVLLLAVVLLWRRTGMGPGPRAPVAGRPTPPPPPPSGPTQPSAVGPMNVSCKHCGASIEITTSKRPIEVMCPSCGETQVVQ